MVKKNIKKDTEILEELSKELFSLMGVKVDVRVDKDEENDALLINLEVDEERGLLIGKKGETINALQIVLGTMLKQSLGEWKRVLVNIGDWREKQEEYLKNLALQAVERVRSTGESQKLYNLNAAQRRIVHMVLSEEKEVVTESEGEGIERCLVVKSAK